MKLNYGLVIILLWQIACLWLRSLLRSRFLGCWGSVAWHPKKRLRLRRLWHLARRYVKFLYLVNWSFMHVIISKHAIEHTCIGREIFFLQQLIALQLDIFNRFSWIYTSNLIGLTSLYFTYVATSMHYVKRAEVWITGASFRSARTKLFKTAILYSFRCCELQIAENARNKAFQLPFSC